MFTVNFISTFNAQVQWRWAVTGECDGDAVIITYFGCFCIPRIWAQVTLTDEGNQVLNRKVTFLLTGSV